VATPAYPTDVAIDTATNDYYVSDGKAGAVSHFNGATNRPLATIRVGTAPDRMAYNQSTNQVYVSNPKSQNVSVIACATDGVTATIPIPGEPDGAASYGATVFVGTLSRPAFLLEIDARTTATTAYAQVGDSAIGVAVNPLTHLAYTANALSNTVSVTRLPPPPGTSQ
jgi:YVTN family beta-propeller protein